MAEIDLNLSYGFYEDRNRAYRRNMEDAHSCVENFAGVIGQAFFAVYDGHAGRQAANWCADNVHIILQNNLKLIGPAQYEPQAVQRAFCDTFTMADKQLAAAGINSGCTAVACFFQFCSSKKTRTLIVANVGDARAVLSRAGAAMRLTYDHKASDEAEIARIISSGGAVFKGRVNGMLAVTRSLGDITMKEVVIGEPYTTRLEITRDDEFLILACDGVWDVLTDQAAVDLVRDIVDAQAAAERLVKRSLELGTQDNLSAIVVRLRKRSTIILPIQKDTSCEKILNNICVEIHKQDETKIENVDDFDDDLTPKPLPRPRKW